MRGAGRQEQKDNTETEGYREKRASETIQQAVPCFGWFEDRGSQGCYFFSSMTSVDLMIAETVSPTFSFISSALFFVITLSMRFLPT